VCWRCKFALLEALLEPWRSFEELWRSFEDLEAIWSLEVQVFTSGGFLEALLEPWRSFEELWRSSEGLEAISSLEVHKYWISALWRYFEAFGRCVHNHHIRDLISPTWMHLQIIAHTSAILHELNIPTLDLSWLSAF